MRNESFDDLERHEQVALVDSIADNEANLTDGRSC
jgi:hypothetical protein